jgi:hypothetical protein
MLVQKVIVSVELEMPTAVFGRESAQLWDWEERFTALRDVATSLVTKRQYDTARALVKYAYSCGASLARRQSSSDAIIFDLAFDKEHAIHFLENMDSCVKGASMV